MGDFLSAAEVVRAIDQAGNRDGRATPGDIRPHLDSEQKILLQEERFHQALRTLNRICGQSADIFRLPSVLSCPVFQNGKIETASLNTAADSHVLSLFEKAFRNNHTDALEQNVTRNFLIS